MVFRTAKNPLERRLQEVAKDSAELRAEIKRLQRALKNPERLLQRVPTSPALLRSPPAPGRPPAAPPAAAPAEAPAPAPTAPPPPAEAPAGGELFSWGPATTPAAPAPAPGRKAAPDDERFAHYFSSTGFLGKPALRQERNVLRNRAIFVAIIVIILGCLLYKMISR